MPRAFAGLLAALWIAFAAAPAARAADAPLDDAARATAVDKAADLLRNRYAFPDVGARLADKLTASLAAGDYRSASTPDALAADLNRDIRQVTQDPHLKAFTKQVVDDPPPQSDEGVARVDMLEDDIGYIELVGFPPVDLFKAYADKAMKLVRGSKALIIDLRRNRGGSPQTVSYAASYFFDPSRPVHLNDIIFRVPNTSGLRTVAFQTSPTPFSYLNRPVIVITGARTISGGEEFAYDLQAQKRATVIGQPTAGGANPGAAMPLIAGLNLFLPTGHAENPVTRTNWEGQGVQPDIPAAPADVMAAAVAAAHRALGLPMASAIADPDDATDEALWVSTELMRPTTGEHPGSLAALKRMIEDIGKGKPDYGAMTPAIAEQTRAQLAALQGAVSAAGAPTYFRFAENDPDGADTYEVNCARGQMRWTIALDGSGKIALASLGGGP